MHFRKPAALILAALALSGCALVGQIVDVVTRPTPAPTPTPTPAIEPPVTPEPQPTPTPGAPFPSGLPSIEPVAGDAGLYAGVVREAAQSVLGCDPGTAGCQWSVPVVEAYDAVTALLRAAGYDAGRYNDDHYGPWAGSDCIAVKARGADVWHEFKLYNYGTLPSRKHSSEFRWSGAFRIVGPASPAEPNVACLSLDWIKLDVQDGKNKRHINATPQHRGAADCDSIGYLGRGDCPLGPEGGTLRPLCEARNGPFSWTATPDPGWDLAPEPSTGLPNPLVIKLEARIEGTVKVCSAGNVCGEIATVKPQ